MSSTAPANRRPLKKQYGRSELEVGWFVIGEDQMPLDWSARELDDCVDDFKMLSMSSTIGTNSFSNINRLLSKCFDFI